MAEKNKINWLSILQGLSMLLVVIGHVSLTNVPRDPSTPIASSIEKIVYSFHMPLFIFISGWLFYHTCLRRNKDYSNVVIAKLKRLGIPFLAFTLVATVLKAAFPSMMHRPVTTQELIDTFILFRSNPLGGMWFIEVLFILMLLYPFYRFAIKAKWSEGLLAVLILLIYSSSVPLTIFNLREVCHMAPFFVGGILCSKYEWQKYLNSSIALGVTAASFLLWNVFGIMPDPLQFLSISIGIVFSFSLCLYLSKILPSLFCSFRDYSFQIFLMGIFFQMAIRWIFVKWGNDLLFVPMWLLSVLIGLYAPTLIARFIEKKAPQGLKLCFGL